MKSHKLQMIVLCLVAIAALFASSNANADTWNKATKITFPEPVEVSGIVLQSGTYWFQLMDGPADRHIVQIWSADRSRTARTFFIKLSFSIVAEDRVCRLWHAGAAVHFGAE